MKNLLLLLILLAFLSGCEKNISLNLKNSDPLLVVDAQIENNQRPTVILTKSFDYFSTISPAILSGLFVHNAEVYMDNGFRLNRFKEFTVSLGGGYSAYYYGLDSSQPGSTFVGEFNRQYFLTIKSEGKEYFARTTIPFLTKYPDSLWFKPAPLNPDTLARVLMARITDPPGLGNYIRFFTRRNNGSFLPGVNSVFDDAIIDGTTYEVQIEPGKDRSVAVPADVNFFRRGDTVTVKVCDIDKSTYTFWDTWEFAQQSIGNPFSQPNKVIGNVSNGALGAFYGYAAWYKAIVAK